MKRGGFDAEGNQDDGSTVMNAVAVAVAATTMTTTTTTLGTGKMSARSFPLPFSVSPELFRTGKYG